MFSCVDNENVFYLRQQTYFYSFFSDISIAAHSVRKHSCGCIRLLLQRFAMSKMTKTCYTVNMKLATHINHNFLLENV